MTQRPKIVCDEYLLFLDELRESARVNMYGAAPILQEEFPELSKSEAREVCSYWRDSFGDRHPE